MEAHEYLWTGGGAEALVRAEIGAEDDIKVIATVVRSLPVLGSVAW